LKLKKTGIIEIYFLVFLFTFSCIPCQVFANADIEPELREYIEHSKKYLFSEDWFSGNIPTWKSILSQFKNKPRIHYLEIGVFEGRSLIWMLENILTHPTARATCVDNFCGDYEKQFRANLKISGFSKKVKTIKGRSQIELRKLPLNSFDLIYIDGSHIAPDALTDAVLSWALLKTDGLLIFDDYLGEEGILPLDLRPRIAIDAFIAAFKNELMIEHSAYQVILKKRKPTSCPYNCVDFGQYTYFWNNKELYLPDKNEPIQLSEGEKKLIDKLIMSRKPEDIGFPLNSEALKDSVFLNLRKRLNLDLGESKEQ